MTHALFPWLHLIIISGLWIEDPRMEGDRGLSGQLGGGCPLGSTKLPIIARCSTFRQLLCKGCNEVVRSLYSLFYVQGLQSLDGLQMWHIKQSTSLHEKIARYIRTPISSMSIGLSPNCWNHHALFHCFTWEYFLLRAERSTGACLLLGHPRRHWRLVARAEPVVLLLIEFHCKNGA